MSFVAERVDADDKFSVHDDGKMPFTSLGGGAWTPIARWYEIDGEAPDSARLEAALESFHWRNGKVDTLPSGACMLSTPMPGVYLEILPEAESCLDRLGFSISGSLHERYLAELTEYNEARWPGRRELTDRIWSGDSATRVATFSEVRARKGTAPLPVQFDRVIMDGITEALDVTLRALSEACAALPDDIVEPGLDETEKASRRSRIEAIFFHGTEVAVAAAAGPSL